MDKNLTLSDWIQFCRKVFSGGDYLFLRSDNKKKNVWRWPERILLQGIQTEMWTCSPSLDAPFNQQVMYDRAVYAQIAITTRAWPNKAAGGSVMYGVPGVI